MLTLGRLALADGDADQATGYFEQSLRVRRDGQTLTALAELAT